MENTAEAVRGMDRNTHLATYVPPDDIDFSLTIGGPLYQLYLRTRLVRPALDLVCRRAIVVSLICWLPLFLLALVAGTAFGQISVPFIKDVGVHVRFLIAVPLLIGAELIVHERSGAMVRQFLGRGIIPLKERMHFDHFVTSSIKLRNSLTVEILLALLVIIAGHWVWSHSVTFGVSTWYAATVDNSPQLTPAGYWYQYVSSFILRFLVLRWYFRIFVWYRFLWNVRGLKLRLNLFHPDRVAGLGFLEESVSAFAPVLLAQSLLVAIMLGDRIRYAGASLTSFKTEIGFTVGFLMLVVLTPLSFFMVPLARAARTARREYGQLGSHYVEEFHSKWVKDHDGNGEALLGTPDIQSLADLGNAYNTISQMRLLPFAKETILRLAILISLPLLPLTLTMVPLEKIVERMVKLVF